MCPAGVSLRPLSDLQTSLITWCEGRGEGSSVSLCGVWPGVITRPAWCLVVCLLTVALCASRCFTVPHGVSVCSRQILAHY